MKLPDFSYHVPDSVEEATALLAANAGDASVLAGGQSLVPLLALRVVQPAHVVDINRIDELGTIGPVNGTVSLGATVRQQRALLEPELRRACPLLTEALPHVGLRETRSRGTIVGSLTHADPAAELPAVAVALDAEVVLRSAEGERVVAAEELFVAPFMTVKAPDELAVALRIPVASPRAGFAFRELERGPFALVAVAAGIELDDAGRVADARLALAGVDGVPVRARAAEALLRGTEPDDAAIDAAVDEASRTIEPPSDVLGSASYRRRVARELARDALLEAAAKAGKEMT